MTSNCIYSERVTSRKTGALFIVLAILFFLLFAWHARVAVFSFLSILFFCLFAFFLFYTLNYRTLIIQLHKDALRLTFGIFTWAVPLDNVEECRLDVVPVLMRMGGAGIHFMFIRKRYRASFNFLEHPRVVIELKRKAGLVRDISFSTCRPNDLLQLIQEAISVKEAA